MTQWLSSSYVGSSVCRNELKSLKVAKLKDEGGGVGVYEVGERRLKKQPSIHIWFLVMVDVFVSIFVFLWVGSYAWAAVDFQNDF